MDPLHCGLERNPLHDNVNDGFVINGKAVASKGFADDTWIVSGSEAGFKRLHEWMLAFCLLNGFVLHQDKSQATGRNAAGLPMRTGLVSIYGKPLVPVPPNKAIRYMGSLIQMDLESQSQISSISSVIGFYTHLAIEARLSVTMAVFFFNTYLMPKLELPLRTACPTADQASKWDAIIGRAISFLARSPQILKAAALSASLGLILPSSLEKISKISESFHRVNGVPGTVATHFAMNRWQDAAAGGVHRSHFNRASRSIVLANDLDISFQPALQRRSWSDQLGVPFGCIVHNGVLDELRLPVVKGHFGSWGTSFANHRATVYAVSSAPNSSVDPQNVQPAGWAFCVVDDALKRAIPPVIDKRTVAKASKAALVVGDQLPSSAPSGFYVANLFALAHALLGLPFSWDLNVYCGASCISALEAFRAVRSHRSQMRLVGRPVLAIIERCLCSRSSAGAITTLSAMPKSSDMSPLDKVARHAASQCAASARGQSKMPFRPLPVHLGELSVSMSHRRRVIVGDPRKEVRRVVNAQILSSWTSSTSQGLLAHAGSDEFLRDINSYIREGALSEADYAMALRLVCNCTEFSYNADGHGHTEVLCMMCEGKLLSDVYHLLSCDSDLSRKSRCDLVQTLLDLLANSSSSVVTSSWVLKHRDSPLMLVIADLFGASLSAHRIRVAIGAFSKTEFSGAMAIAGVSDSSLWPVLGRQVRLLLFSHVRNEWLRR